MTDPEYTTTDSLFRGRIKIVQKKKGYRFSIDATILAHHIRLRAGDLAVDLGTGCGIVPLILSLQTPSARLYGIEVQQDLADLAAENIRLNRMEEAISVFHGDMKDYRRFLPSGKADVVFANPPYRKLRSGRINPETERAVARHEIRASLSDVVAVAEGLLKPSGRFLASHLAERAVDLTWQMRKSGLEPKWMRWIHSARDSEAKLVLVEGLKGGRPALKVRPPLFIYETDGEYTDEVKQMLGE